MIHILYVAFYIADGCVCRMLDYMCMCACCYFNACVFQITVQLHTEYMDENNAGEVYVSPLRAM